MAHYNYFPTNYIIILFSLIFILTVYYIHVDKKNHINEIDYKYTDTLIDKVKKLLLNLQFEQSDKREYLEKRDEKVLYDDFYPPERRLPEYQYPFNNIKKKIWNIPTNGYPDNYQLMGIVIRSNTETAYNLFGRQKYPRSNQYEYYVEGQMHNTKIKIPIKVKGDREIYNKQEIHIHGTDPSKGPFIVELYDYDLPRYNPYDY
jgi:hypothetical protein|uniref:Uncharacterized protein n=1 Tax=viral metagenome TaxID=1070528 RepID=A0A6C0ED90_9ZZZZ